MEASQSEDNKTSSANGTAREDRTDDGVSSSSQSESSNSGQTGTGSSTQQPPRGPVYVLFCFEYE